jgi:hypothetical protein
MLAFHKGLAKSKAVGQRISKADLWRTAVLAMIMTNAIG